MKEFCGLCGTVTVTSIYQTLYPDSAWGVETFVQKLIDLNSRVIAGGATVGFEDLVELAANEEVGLQATYGQSHNDFRSASEYFEGEIRPNLNGSQWPIIAVCANGNTGRVGYGTAPHFIAVDGLSRPASEAEPLWVRIYNPMWNRTEYYPAEGAETPNTSAGWAEEPLLGFSPRNWAANSTLWVGM